MECGLFLVGFRPTRAAIGGPVERILFLVILPIFVILRVLRGFVAKLTSEVT
jgi:hypothetical protein